MLKKLLITLKYGETKVKTYLIGVIVLLIAGLVLLIMGISGQSLIFLGTGAVLLIAGLLVMFSFSFVDIDVDLEKKAPKREKIKPETKKEVPEEEEETDYDDEDIDFSALEEELSDLAIGVEGLSLKSEKKKKKEKNEGKGTENTAETSETADTGDGAQESLEDILKEHESGGDYDPKEAMGLDEEETEQTNTERRKSDDLYEVKKPTPKEVKARKKMLKVRKDDRRYTPILVDSWKEARALHTPAFVQEKGRLVNIILVEGALRTELIPMSEFLQCTYRRNVEEKLAEDFDAIKQEADVNAIFGELLPSLYPGTGRSDTEVMYKNQYILGGKIAITPRSLRKLFNKFDFEFKVFDSLNIKGKYSTYFKQAYESRVFWTDNVISQNDYQERIRRVLQSMVDNKELRTAEFEADLDLMVRFNLITTEYADYYKARKKDNIKIKI
ncbi:MAG: hypothetical protein K6E47_01735 [Lachnospiraceae bacterium]|nr:hypothetical protein [Lachnospiraceae bacterium]